VHSKTETKFLGFGFGFGLPLFDNNISNGTINKTTKLSDLPSLIADRHRVIGCSIKLHKWLDLVAYLGFSTGINADFKNDNTIFLCKGAHLPFGHAIRKNLNLRIFMHNFPLTVIYLSFVFCLLQIEQLNSLY